MAKLFSTLCCCLILLLSSSCCSVSGHIDFGAVTKSLVVNREERTVITKTEYGEVSAVDMGSALRGAYHLQFITLEPNALFLPVLLHADVVLYVRTGSGRLTWVGEDDSQRVDLKCGDIYRLTPGTMFHVQSDLEDRREKLRIYAFFTNTEDDHYDPLVGAYSSVGDLLRGFYRRVLQEAFNAPEDVVDEIMSASRPAAIIHAASASASESKARMFFEQESRMLTSYLTGAGIVGYNKKKVKVFNVYKAEKDFENCNGWSLTVTRKDDHTLRRT